MLRTWEAPANYDRRKALLRCRCCRKVIAQGAPAIMTRMAQSRGNRIWAVHADCGDKRHSEAYTWREVLTVWGILKD